MRCNGALTASEGRDAGHPPACAPRPPGETGPAVLAAHVDYAGVDGAFVRLDQVGPGDTVDVERADGSTATFTAYRAERFPQSAFPTEQVHGDTAGPELRLITCGGVFDDASGNYADNGWCSRA